MARPKASEPRVAMKIPVRIRDELQKEALAHGFTETTKYLDGKKIVIVNSE